MSKYEKYFYVFIAVICLGIGAIVYLNNVNFQNNIESNLGDVTGTKKANPITVTSSQTKTVGYSTSAQTIAFTSATKGQGTVTYSISSQKNSKGQTVSLFSIPTSTKAAYKIKAKPTLGTYTLVIKAKAAGNKNYKAGTKIITIKVTIKKANPITVTANQGWTSTYSKSSKDFSFKGATKAQGSVTYSITSQKDSKGKSVSLFSIPTSSKAVLRKKASTAAGTYKVVIKAKAAGNSTYNSGSKNITITVKVNKSSTTSNFLDSVHTVKEGSSITLKLSTSLKVTYSSQNPKVATVTSAGKVTGKKAGSVKIIAKTSNGAQYETTVVVLAKSPAKSPVTYSSSTLKYWIQYFSVKAGNDRVKKYTLTNIWMKDPYNQMKVAHPLRYITPENIMKNEISTYGYAKKGILALNASPSNDKGIPEIPIVIGTNKKGTKVIKNTGKGGHYTYALGKDGILRAYVSKNTTPEKLQKAGVKYTFGFRPVIVSNGKYSASSVENAINWGLSELPDVRSTLCQIDKNNFVLITGVGYSLDLADRRKYGLTLKEIGDMMLELNCITGVNLDGGSSLTYMYKTNKSTNFTYLRKSGKTGRGDVLYFVEK